MFAGAGSSAFNTEWYFLDASNARAGQANPGRRWPSVAFLNAQACGGVWVPRTDYDANQWSSRVIKDALDDTFLVQRTGDGNYYRSAQRGCSCNPLDMSFAVVGKGAAPAPTAEEVPTTTQPTTTGTPTAFTVSGVGSTQFNGDYVFFSSSDPLAGQLNSGARWPSVAFLQGFNCGGVWVLRSDYEANNWSRVIAKEALGRILFQQTGTGNFYRSEPAAGSCSPEELSYSVFGQGVAPVPFSVTRRHLRTVA